MAIAMPGEDRLPSGPVRDFVQALHALYNTAGQPSARIISSDIRQSRELRETVSHETVSSALRGDSVPSWAKVQSIVSVLARTSVQRQDTDALLRNFQALWLAARQSPSADSWLTAVPGTQKPPYRDDSLERPMQPGAGRPKATTIHAEPASVTPPRQHVPHTQVVGGLPGRNDAFIGRELLIDRMRERLVDDPQAPLVLYGLGGTGKTQLAREYVEKYRDQYQVIWWVPAEQARTSLVNLAERLEVPTQLGFEQTINALLGRLESQRIEYVLIFDGVEDNDIRRLMPTIGGHVIVTSRDPAWANESSSSGLEVPDFDQSEAIQFLRTRDSQVTGDQADRLAQVCGRLPLALEQVSALQQAAGMPWDDLLDRLDKPGEKLLSTGQPAHYPHTVAASLDLALDRLRAANPAAALVFELFAWFGSEPVSVGLLRGGRAGDVSPPLARALRNPVLLRKAIADISKFGLARLFQDQRIEVQPLTRLALRDVLTADVRERAQRNVHEILAAANPGWPDELASWDMHREMAAHVLPSGLVDSRVEPAQNLVFHQIRYRYLTGDHEDAAYLGQTAVTTWKHLDFLGLDHELVLLATREWANALRATGKYQRARGLTAEAMDRLEANPEFGEDHEHTLAMANSLAADLRIAGEYSQALEVDIRNYRRYVERYGESNRLTVTSRHNLAISLRLAGDFAGAAALDQAALERHRSVQGEEHLLTLLAVNALAEDLYGLGRYAEALDLQLRYRDAGRRVLGAHHKGVLLATRTIALARRALGAVAEATDALRNHYHDCVASFGDDHEYTLAATTSYANALRQRGHLDEAYLHANDAVSSYMRTFGPRNPLTRAAEVNLAATHRARGERAKARQTDTGAREGLLATVGARHPYTIAATIGLATDHSLAGDHVTALTLSREAYQVSAEVRGPHHPDTLAAGANLAIDRRQAGATDEADAQLKEILATLRRTLGTTHPVVTDVASGTRIECDIEPLPA